MQVDRIALNEFVSKRLFYMIPSFEQGFNLALDAGRDPRLDRLNDYLFFP